MDGQKKVKVAVVGLGNMGAAHVQMIFNAADAEIVGVCDIDKDKADRVASGCNAPAYYCHTDLFENSGLEAVIIAVPHYDHEPIAIEAFSRGIHVMCEKPITVHVNGAVNMIKAYEESKNKYPDLIFGIMFQERTSPYYQKIKDVINGGELGRLTRVTWINTAWFRSQAYYDSGGWRATWAGEGGGILTNQCPHNLDMYQWLFGMPATVDGFAHIGKYHDIEVEDEVTAYFEHESGLIGHFIVSTGECPGVNRLEIVGENGTLLCQHGTLTFFRNRMSMLKYSRETDSGFSPVENWETKIPYNQGQTAGHSVVNGRFFKSILSGQKDLTAFGEEGLNQVMLANAIMLSSFDGRRVALPLDGQPYEEKLADLIKKSKYVKSSGAKESSDFESSLTR
ncbi:MAG: Gfo/Idh/MocA family oxidoreductase [Defluviitaleaceae bacterium]|nr:Gfo/Idh/MocA family oxidoreductase [Defluviitaleaceae bacterium]